MNNTEKTQMIAKFMGYNKISPVEYRIPEYERMIAFKSLTGAKNSNTHFRSDIFKIRELQFSKSWDWLMPVVQTCKERQIFGSQQLIDEIDNILCVDLEINHLFEAVVKFIEWYNQNPKP